MKKHFILHILNFTFLTLHSFCFSQHTKIDSLLNLLNAAKADTCKLQNYNRLSTEYNGIGSYDSALLYANSALQLSNDLLKETTDTVIKRTLKKGSAASYHTIGNVYLYQANYPLALKNHLASLKIKEEIADKKGIASSYNNIGIVYDLQGNYPEAIKNYFASLKIKEAIGDKKGIAYSYNNIGIIYKKQGNYQEALKNYFASLKIREELDDKKGVAASYNNIGIIYELQHNYPEALKNHLTSLKIKEETGDKAGIATAYNNIGSVYSSQGNYPEALKNQFASLEIQEAIGDKAGIAGSNCNIGNVFTLLKRYNEAEMHLKKAIELSKEIGLLESLEASYKSFTDLDNARGNFKGAYENQTLYFLYRDSLNNEDSRKKIIQGQMTYDFEKKEAETKAEQDKKDVLAKVELKQKEQQRNYFSVGFVLVALLALFILIGYRQKRKANFIITRQKEEVELAKLIIEEKNKDITDSINYAKRIQGSVLPHRSEIWAAFPESFVLFKPKDIVSGDFYYFHKNKQTAIIAVADCTGHGVPGAFMSIIGTVKLNDAVSESTDTSKILSLLNKGIKSALKQSNETSSSRDGMDIAICSVDVKNRIVTYAGANRPLWIIHSGSTEVKEIKATKSSIGGFTEDNQDFESHEIKLTRGDSFYLFSDGYADTFSGKTGKKLMTRKLKEILLGIQNKTMNEQKQHLENFIKLWKEGTEQVDDILVIGIRL